MLPAQRTAERDPAGQPAGWSDADTRTAGTAWNACALDVDGVRRVPLEGLARGNQRDFAGVEADKTTEAAGGKAIVLVPLAAGRPGEPPATALDPTEPVDILLHLHGFGFRAQDPHAGWRRHRRWGTVRDVDQDRVEAQLRASNAPQLVAVLPQGVGGSDFGLLPVHDYLDEVLGRLVATHELSARPAGPLIRGRLVLSGHSGGGDRIARLLSGPVGGQVAEVVLFEAIHKAGLGTVVNWATGHLDRVRTVLADPASTAAARHAAIDACPRLRGYFSTPVEGDERSGRYAGTYAKLAAALAKWFAAHGGGLGPDLAAVRDRFQVVALTGAGHETVIRGLGDDPAAGPLADALTALYQPRDPARRAPATLLTAGTPTWRAGRRQRAGL